MPPGRRFSDTDMRQARAATIDAQVQLERARRELGECRARYHALKQTHQGTQRRQKVLKDTLRRVALMPCVCSVIGPKCPRCVARDVVGRPPEEHDSASHPWRRDGQLRVPAETPENRGLKADRLSARLAAMGMQAP